MALRDQLRLAKAQGSHSPNQCVVITLVLAAACAIEVAFGCPMGLSADENWPYMFVIHTWLGIFFAVPVSLAAWATLRDIHWTRRIATPLSLLTLFIFANALGMSWNQRLFDPASIVGISASFMTACVFFMALRAMLGWKIGPTRSGKRRIDLSLLFVWTSVAALMFATLAWIDGMNAGNERLLLSLPESGRAAMSFSLGTIVTSLIATACIGLAMDVPKRRRIFGGMLLLVILCSAIFVIVVSIQFGTGPGTGATFVAAPVAFMFFQTWAFYLYRTLGYTLTRHVTSATPYRGYSALAIGCLTLLLLAGNSFLLLKSKRGEQAMRAEWKPYNALPFNAEGTKATGVQFDVNMPVTRRIIDKMEQEQIRLIVFRNYSPPPEHVRSIANMRSVLNISFQGGVATKQQLEQLYDAKQLKTVEFSSVSGITPADIDGLQAALPNCYVSASILLPDGSLTRVPDEPKVTQATITVVEE